MKETKIVTILEIAYETKQVLNLYFSSVIPNWAPYYDSSRSLLLFSKANHLSSKITYHLFQKLHFKTHNICREQMKIPIENGAKVMNKNIHRKKMHRLG